MDDTRSGATPAVANRWAATPPPLPPLQPVPARPSLALATTRHAAAGRPTPAPLPPPSPRPSLLEERDADGLHPAHAHAQQLQQRGGDACEQNRGTGSGTLFGYRTGVGILRGPTRLRAVGERLARVVGHDERPLPVSLRVRLPDG